MKGAVSYLNDLLALVFENTYLRLNPIESINSLYYINWQIYISPDEFMKTFVNVEKTVAKPREIEPRVWETLLQVARSVVPFSMKEIAWAKLARTTAELTLEFYRKYGKVNLLIIYAGFADYNEGKGFLVEEIRNAIYSAIIEDSTVDYEEISRNLHFTVIDRMKEPLKLAEEQIRYFFPRSTVDTIRHYDLVALKRLLVDWGRKGYYDIVVNTSLFGKHPFSTEFYKAVSLLTRVDGYFLSANGHHALWKSPFITRKLLERLPEANLELFDEFLYANFESIVPFEKMFHQPEERLQTELVIEYYVRLNEAFKNLSLEMGKKVLPPDPVFDSTITIGEKLQQLRESFFTNRMVPVVSPIFRGNKVNFIYATVSRRLKE